MGFYRLGNTWLNDLVRRAGGKLSDTHAETEQRVGTLSTLWAELPRWPSEFIRGISWSYMQTPMLLAAPTQAELNDREWLNQAYPDVLLVLDYGRRLD
mmetsp:Transcript_68934/g.162216  ORF Transcript_68934/g.162216 Transcript_68934/m.162216 type:complete len:98 (+) Transcript_68934:401-694(+)